MFVVVGKKDGTVCTLCKFLVGYIDKELKDKKTEVRTFIEDTEDCPFCFSLLFCW